MKWSNLLKNKCPACGSRLTVSTIADILPCLNMKCDFKITIRKFQAITQDMVVQEHALQKHGIPPGDDKDFWE